MWESRLVKEYKNKGSLSWYGSYISNSQWDASDCDNNKKNHCVVKLQPGEEKIVFL